MSQIMQVVNKFAHHVYNIAKFCVELHLIAFMAFLNYNFPPKKVRPSVKILFIWSQKMTWSNPAAHQ